MTRWFGGSFVAARGCLEQALAIDDAERDSKFVFRFGQDVASSAMAYLALVLWPLGVLDSVDSFIEDAVIRASETKHTSTIAYAYAHAASFEMMRRDRQRAAPNVEALLTLAQEHGMAEWIALGTFQKGWLRWSSVDRKAGLAKMREGISLMR